MLDNFLSGKMEEIKEAGLLRKLRLIQSAPSASIIIDGKKFLNLSSNNYLNLAGNKEINNAALHCVEKYGFAGASSRLLGGNLEIHEQLEAALAEFKNKQASLIFASGYQANLGVISALASGGEESCVIMDKLNHASLWDGAKLSGARIFVYEHCDMESFEKVLKRAEKYKVKLAVTEAVFSMDGDFTPLKEFTQLCRQYGAVSVVDEAHSTGVFGKEGRGLAEMFGVGGDIDVSIGTLSKAFAVQGGFVCGSRHLVNYLVNKCRAFIYTTAVSPAICAAALKALEIVKKSDEKRKQLLELSGNIKEKLKNSGFNVSNTRSQIVPVITGSILSTEKAAQSLWDNGIYAPAVKPPTVSDGSARLRFSFISGHTAEDGEILVKHMRNIE